VDLQTDHYIHLLLDLSEHSVVSDSDALQDMMSSVVHWGGRSDEIYMGKTTCSRRISGGGTWPAM
jgi:putative lipase involved disintegration of autophagic bodies